MNRLICLVVKCKKNCIYAPKCTCMSNYQTCILFPPYILTLKQVQSCLYPIKKFSMIFLLLVVFQNWHKISLPLRNLTGVKINTEEDAIKAMQILHDKGPRTVVISSSEFSHDTSIICLASSVTSTYYSRAQHWGCRDQY